MTRDSGSLSPREESARQALRALPPVAPDPDFLSRLESDFVEGRLEQRERFRTTSAPRWAWLAVPVAAAALLAIVLGRGGPDISPAWLVLGTSGTGTLEWAGETRELADLAADTELPREGGPIALDDGWIEIGRPGVVAVRLNAGSRAELSAPPGDDPSRSVWNLALGELQVLTGPGFAGNELWVQTPEGRTEVVGTAFAVYRDESGTCVCVLEGVARIGMNTADLEDVAAGFRKVMFADGRPPQRLDIVPEHRAGLQEFVSDVRDRVGRR